MSKIPPIDRRPKGTPAPPPKPCTIPSWICPKCGATHPITVSTCCAPPMQITC